jgi:WD40 repeat protein
VTTNFDWSIRLWDIDGNLLQEHSLPWTEPHRIAFSPDGKTFAVGTLGGKVILGDVSTRKLTRTLASKHEAAIHSLEFGLDGRYLATGSRDNTALIWRTDSWTPAGSPMRHMATVTGLHYLSDRALISTGFDGARRWRVAMDPTRIERSVGNKVVASSTVRPISLANKMLLASEGHELKMVQGKVAKWRQRIDGEVSASSLAPDDQHYALGTDRGALYLQHPLTVAPGDPLSNLSARVSYIDFTPDGRRLLAVSGNKLSVWDVPARIRLWEQTFSPSVFRWAFSLDSRNLFALSADSLFSLEASSGRLQAELPGSFRCVAIEPQSRSLWVGDANGRVLVLAEDLTQLKEAEAHQAAVVHIAFSGDNLFAGTAGADNVARVWRIHDLTPVCPAIRHGGPVNTVAFSPDGRLLLSLALERGGSDVFWLARLSDVSSGLPARPRIHCFNAAGRGYFLHDGSICIVPWNGGDAVFTRQPMATVPSEPQEVHAFSQRITGLQLTDDGDVALLSADDWRSLKAVSPRNESYEMR